MPLIYQTMLGLKYTIMGEESLAPNLILIDNEE
jgi:hypothetical protein